MDKKQFYEQYGAYAKKASAMLGLDWKLILANWSWETGFATNKTVEYNNLGGIKYVGQKTAYDKSGGPGYAKYRTMDDFVKDYVRVMKLPYYRDVIKSAETSTFMDDIIAHNKSPYSVADYNPKSILDRINSFAKMEGTSPAHNTEISIPPVDDMKRDDLIKYATIGLGVIMLSNLFNN